MATATFQIEPQDGWVAVTSGSVSFILMQRYPHTQPFFVTTGSTTPPTNTAAAEGTITFSGQPVASETITVGGTTYTFVASATLPTDVEIGADAAATLNNLVAALSTNTDVSVVSSTSTVISLEATAEGEDGNTTVLSDTATNVTVSGSGTLSGGTTRVEGYRVDCEFRCDVTVADNFYVRCTNWTADLPLTISVFTVTA